MHSFTILLSFYLTLVSSHVCKPNDCVCPNSTFAADVWQGDLKSPRGSDGNYCPFLDCNYTIAAGPEGTATRLHFERFRTETLDDYLEVNQTEDGKHIRLDRLSGNMFVPDYTSVEGNGFDLRFHTDSYDDYRGFEAVFTRFNISDTDCICPKIFRTASDQVQNISYPVTGDTYCKRIKCYFVLRAEDVYTVKLSLNWIDVDLHDKVSVYDIDSRYHGTSNMLLYWSGRDVGSVRQQEIVSRSHGFVVIFESDSQQGGRGFSAQFVQTTSPCHCVSTRTYVSPSQEGIFTSPGYPSPYCDDYDCTHTFYTNSSYVIQYQVHNFSTEYQADYLYVQEQLDDSQRILQKWHGIMPVRDRTVYTTNSNTSSLRFRTNYYDIASGFNLTYKAVTRTSSCSCGRPQPYRFSSLSGSTPSVIHDSNCPSIDCMYILERPSNTQDMTLNFSLNAPNPYGHLAFYKGTVGAKNADLVSKWVGVDLNETRSYSLSGTSYLLHYHSEANGTIDNYSGFNFTFEWKPPCTCSPTTKYLTAENVPKTITSPNYPHNYCNSVRCTYQINAPYGQHVVLSINSFKTENGNDYLKIYDDDSTYSQYLIASYSGFITMLPVVVRSTGRTMTTYFSPDGSVTYSGFSAEYYAESVAPKTSTTTTFQTTTTRNSTIQSTPTLAPSTQKAELSSGNVSSSSTGWMIVTITLLLLVALAGCAIVFMVYTGRMTLRKAGIAHAYYNHRDSNLTLDDGEANGSDSSMT